MTLTHQKETVYDVVSLPPFHEPGFGFAEASVDVYGSLSFNMSFYGSDSFFFVDLSHRALPKEL